MIPYGNNAMCAFSLLSTNVGKAMPISRIVVAVPNTTVVLLD
jgi:hypothetical protein